MGLYLTNYVYNFGFHCRRHLGRRMVLGVFNFCIDPVSLNFLNKFNIAVSDSRLRINKAQQISQIKVKLDYIQIFFITTDIVLYLCAWRYLLFFWKLNFNLLFCIMWYSNFFLFREELNYKYCKISVFAPSLLKN